MDRSTTSSPTIRRWPAPARGLVMLGLLLGVLLIWASSVSAASGGAKVFGLTTSDRLVSFDRAAPGNILSKVRVTGLKEGEHLVGMDFRPANGRLYGIGSTSQVYVINRKTGAASSVGDGFAPPLVGDRFGVDFNPTVDAIRIVSHADQNLRVSPATGEVIGVDLPLNYAGGDENFGEDPDVVGVAYRNNRAGATTTELYDIDSGLDVLASQDPPNNGTLNTHGELGVDTTGLVGFDIAPGYGALAALKPANGKSRLYGINLDTGKATDRGVIGTRQAVKDIAIPLVVPSG